MQSSIKYLLLLYTALYSSLLLAELSFDRKEELTNLVYHDCGACHGLKLKGGLGPALTHTQLTAKDSEALVQTVLLGRPGTAMPPWNVMLSKDEAVWIVENLKIGAFSDGR